MPRTMTAPLRGIGLLCAPALSVTACGSSDGDAGSSEQDRLRTVTSRRP